ncbi:TraB/GumN family protein [Cognatiluteimonas profundi]|uniref:TraB/GumN family protein n=1 Tax=Cognatiluteimonas profundi TaxID=2594501 RepID=UPI00131C5CEB|nr:TraB/GumN family protein [Lysobacter profundi]
MRARSALTFLTTLLLAVATFAASASPPVPLLWKVSDADSSVYLLGSFHLLKPGDYPLSADVDKAFGDAQALMFEIPPQEMASPALAMQMRQAGLRVDGTRLDDDLDPLLRQKLAGWFASDARSGKASGITPEMLQQFRPWLAGLMISVVGMQEQGLDPALGLDEHFASAAAAAGKPVAGLETGAQQIAFLAAMDRDEQLQFLAEALGDSEPGNHELETLHAAWRRGDAATLWTVMAAAMKRDYPKLYRHIDIDRNDAWVPQIERRLASPDRSTTLVVVGALHLLGSDGVVEKLRARGYRVERVCSACPGRKH